jgi:hypothetical protein
LTQAFNAIKCLIASRGVTLHPIEDLKKQVDTRQLRSDPELTGSTEPASVARTCRGTHRASCWNVSEKGLPVDWAIVVVVVVHSFVSLANGLGEHRRSVESDSVPVKIRRRPDREITIINWP